ncbi:LEA domain protein [Aspergillus arachidicola]|uniref:LEA domain protein n=1 Tax=Aspergillus arachidicola TaxID=656916 RepID=A0A2G7FSS0_9EURO|nr:LEA domain protein [Aspergillus arachidicola]
MAIQKYDTIGDSYNDVPQLATGKLQLAAIQALIGDIKGLTVLELACGPGFYCRKAISWGALQATGVDISPAMIYTARTSAKGDKRMEFHIADCIQPFNINIGQFDLILAPWLLNYARNESELICMWRNIYSSLKPGGKIIGITTNLHLLDDPAAFPKGRRFGQELEVLGAIEDGGLEVRATLFTYAECQAKNTSLDPEPVQKWAEESYAVVQITLEHETSADDGGVLALVERGIGAFESSHECEKKDMFAMLIYGSPADYAPAFGKILGNLITGLNKKLAAAVFFSSWDMSEELIPILSHIPGNFQPTGPAKKDNHTVYSYADVSSAGFIVPGHADFKITSAGVAHTRSLTFLKKHLNGPYFDLEKIWEEHTWYEFGDRSVEKTMATMVQEPYVNHIPTMTGGIGRARLSKFYLENFIFNNPTDTALELISRTVGTDRIVDEFIFSLTHNKEIDWLLPGIPPTGKPLRIPFTSVVNIRGDRLYHEHIAWDQATVLVQLGLMPEYLPYPYALPGGQLPGPGKRFEYRVPAAGVETAMKLQDEHAVPSNGMFEFKVREVNDE